MSLTTSKSKREIVTDLYLKGIVSMKTLTKTIMKRAYRKIKGATFKRKHTDEVYNCIGFIFPPDPAPRTHYVLRNKDNGNDMVIKYYALRKHFEEI